MKCLPYCLGGVLTGLAVATSAWAAPQVATLADGRQVILHDDFTWQYVVPVEQRQHPTSVQSTPKADPGLTVPAAPAASVAVPVAASVQGAYVTLGDSKNIQQLSRSGVDVVLRPASYQNGKLVIPTSLTNQSTRSVVLVEMSVTVRNEQGRELGRHKDKIWLSVKRMPETYFRPKTQQEGRPLMVSVPEAKGYFIEADIVEVEHW